MMKKVPFFMDERFHVDINCHGIGDLQCLFENIFLIGSERCNLFLGIVQCEEIPHDLFKCVRPTFRHFTSKKFSNRQIDLHFDCKQKPEENHRILRSVGFHLKLDLF